MTNLPAVPQEVDDVEALSRLLASGLAEEAQLLSIQSGSAVKRPVLASSYAVHRGVRCPPTAL